MMAEALQRGAKILACGNGTSGSIAIVASALLLQGCELAVIGAAGTAAYSIAEDRRASGTQFDDRTIPPRAESRVYDRFKGKVHVTATSFNRAVLLTGEVPDEATRQE